MAPVFTPTSSQLLDASGPAKDEILAELQTVLDSPSFRTSLRAREFLSYVVHQTLDGDGDSLKERSIGVHLYHRAPSYITGEDPVVRVKAGEVRRRLTKHYAENPESNIRIDLPTGSYVPHFHSHSGGLPATTAVELTLESTPMPPLPAAQESTSHRSHHWTALLFLALCVAAAAVVYATRRSPSKTQQFWKPLLASHKSVLLCIPSPVSYALSTDASERLGVQHAKDAGSELARNTSPVVLDPEGNLKGKDITPLVDYYVNKDDAYVMSELSGLFTRMGEDEQVRIGKDLTFAELQSSPAVLVGAYNNPWTLKISTDLPYAFRERNSLPLIQDVAHPNDTWFPEAQGRLGSRDFAVIARLITSKTGQPLVIVAGTGMVGTEAAGRLLSDENALNNALAGAPAGWPDKNLELVLETDQVDASAAPPRVVKIAVW